MKKKEKIELGQKSLAELGKLLVEAKDKLVRFRMETHTQKMKNVRAVARLRDDIARLLTTIGQKKFKEVTHETV